MTIGLKAWVVMDFPFSKEVISLLVIIFHLGVVVDIRVAIKVKTNNEKNYFVKNI